MVRRANKMTEEIESTEIIESVESVATEVPEVVEPESVKIKSRRNVSNFEVGRITSTKTITLASKLNNPVHISYGSSTIVVPPRGKLSNLDPNMLGSVPKGIDFILK